MAVVHAAPVDHGRLSRMMTTDFCPWANRFVYWLKEPVGWFALATAVSVTIGLYFSPIGWTLAASLAAIIVTGMAWPWVAVHVTSCALYSPIVALVWTDAQSPIGDHSVCNRIARRRDGVERDDWRAPLKMLLVVGAKASSFASSMQSDDAVQRRGLDIIMPPGVIGATMLAGLVALSVVVCYAYYPAASECLEEIGIARAECLSAANSGQVEHALHWLPVWEGWSRRLEVGTFLRTGQVRPYQRMQGYLIRKKLELLEHELEHDPPEPEETQQVVRNLQGTDSRWVRAFRETE